MKGRQPTLVIPYLPGQYRYPRQIRSEVHTPPTADPAEKRPPSHTQPAPSATPQAAPEGASCARTGAPARGQLPPVMGGRHTQAVEGEAGVSGLGSAILISESNFPDPAG